MIDGKGLKLTVLSPGDIVTLKVKPQPNGPSDSIFGGDLMVRDEATNASHYRHTSIFRIIEANSTHAVVEKITGYDTGRREVLVVSQHEWSEASALYAAMEPTSPAMKGGDPI